MASAVAPIPPAAKRQRRAYRPSDPSKSVLAPADWIAAGEDVLVDQGIDQLRVDVLAGKLGVTRGSFYWHFRDREELLRAILQAWRERATVQITRRLGLAHSDPEDQLSDLVSLPFRGQAAARAAQIELAIRAWARRDAMARAAVDDADSSRMAYITTVFRAIGFAPDGARARAFLLYDFIVAESLLTSQGTAAQRKLRISILEKLLLGR